MSLDPIAPIGGAASVSADPGGGWMARWNAVLDAVHAPVDAPVDTHANAHANANASAAGPAAGVASPDAHPPGALPPTDHPLADAAVPPGPSAPTADPATPQKAAPLSALATRLAEAHPLANRPGPVTSTEAASGRPLQAAVSGSGTGAAAPGPAEGAPASRPSAAPAAAAASAEALARPVDVVSVPVQLRSMQVDAGSLQPAAGALNPIPLAFRPREARPSARARRPAHPRPGLDDELLTEAQADDAAPASTRHDPDGLGRSQTDDGPDHPSSWSFGELQTLIWRAGLTPALQELAAGRRVLLWIRPRHALASAAEPPDTPDPQRWRACVLWRDAGGVGHLHDVAIRWRADPARPATGWRQWRAHHEQGSDGRDQLSVRPDPAGTPDIRLDPWRAGAAAAPAADREWAEIPDGRGLLRALGRQWSLLIVRAPSTLGPADLVPEGWAAGMQAELAPTEPRTSAP